MKRALILDACQRSALATTRSLGKNNVPVITSDSEISSLAGSSRYSTAYFQSPDPKEDSEKFIHFISNLCQEQNIQIIYPMTELTTTLLLENKSCFSSCVIPFPDLETVNSISDKCELMKAAAKLSIPIPHTQHESFPPNLQFSLPELSYPIVIKPGMSWLKNNGKWFRSEVQFADTPDTLNTIINSDPALRIHNFMLQECVEGAGQGMFALYNNGKAVAFFNHQRLREKPYWGGVSVLSQSIELNHQLLTHTKALLDSVKWHGIAMVEFKVSKDGVPYLMEVNTRFWGSLQLAVDSGVDFPWLLYKLSFGENVKEVITYKTGVRLRWLLGDLDSLYILLKDKGLPLSKKLKAILDFITPAPLSTRHEVNRITDLNPFWWELKRYIKDLFK